MDRAGGAESQHAQMRKRENIEMGVLTPAEQILGGVAAVTRHFAHVAQVKLILHGLFLLDLQVNAGTNVIFESRASKVSCISFQKSHQSAHMDAGFATGNAIQATLSHLLHTALQISNSCIRVS
jgi:hypothetical protein